LDSHDVTARHDAALGVEADQASCPLLSGACRDQRHRWVELGDELAEPGDVSSHVTFRSGVKQKAACPRHPVTSNCTPRTKHALARPFAMAPARADPKQQSRRRGDMAS
jgi:hypothetical protein